MAEGQRIEQLIEQIAQGRLSRREAIRRALGLGLGLPGAMALISQAAARQATPVAIPEPPVAAVIPHTFDFDGITLDDPYAWLENPDDPAVIAYLEAENAYADAMMAPTAALQQTLYAFFLRSIGAIG